MILTPDGRSYPDRESYLRALAVEAAGVLARRPAAHIVVPLVGEQAQAPHFLHPTADLPSRAAGLIAAAQADGAVHIHVHRGVGGLGQRTSTLLPERAFVRIATNSMAPLSDDQGSAVIDAMLAALHKAL